VVAEILSWLRSSGIDVVIVEPPYGAAVADDPHYSELVRTLRGVARQHEVPVVLRHDAMRFLSGKLPPSPGQHFRLHDLSRRCGPEHVAATVAALLATQVQASPGASPSR
jgi:hypothetical protein